MLNTVLPFQDVIKNFSGIVLVTNANHEFIASNTYTSNIFGYNSLDKMLGNKPGDIPCKAAECSTDFIMQNEKVISTQETLNMIDIHPYRNNETKIFLVKKSPLANLKGIVCFATEITQGYLYRLAKVLTFKDKKINFLTNKTYKLANTESSIKASSRELECIFFLLRGYSLAQIGKVLSLSKRTVESYVENLKSKFHCNSKCELIETLIENHFLDIIPQSFSNKNISIIV